MYQLIFENRFKYEEGFGILEEIGIDFEAQLPELTIITDELEQDEIDQLGELCEINE